MFELYIFSWYDSSSDDGWNSEYLITDDPDTHAEEIGHECTYEKFEQKGFKVKITKKKVRN